MKLSKVAGGLVLLLLAGSTGYIVYNNQSLQAEEAVVAEVQARHLPASADARERISHEVAYLAGKRNFAELETISERMRTNDERTSDGWSTLTSFYDGTDKALFELEQHHGMAEVDKYFEEWAAAHPKSITQLVAKASCKVEAAWLARGSGYAGTVREEQWNVFNGLLKEAFLTLAEAGKIEGKFDPYGHSLYFTMGAALGAKREDMEAVLEEGVSRYPTYEGLYRGMAHYLLPRWHGEPGDIEKMAAEVAEALPAPLGDIMYSRIVGTVWNYESNKLFETTEFEYERVRKAYEALITAYPEGTQSKRVLCNLAVIGNDKETAKRLFDELPEWNAEDTKTFWGGPQALTEAKAWAAGTGENPVEVSALEVALNGGDIDLVKQAVEAGGNVNRHFSCGSHPLMKAIDHKNDELTKYLLEKGADVRSSARNTLMVAGYAAREGNTELVELALQQGLGINDPINKNGWTMLMLACYGGSEKSVEYLLGKPGIDVEAKFADGQTAIFLAGEMNEVGCLKRLIAAGANVNARDNRSITPINQSAHNGCVESIKVLLEAGADPTIKSVSGVSPLDTAERKHKAEASKVLREAIAARGAQ